MEGTWEELETQLKKRTSHGNCYHLPKSGGRVQNRIEDDSPDFIGTVGLGSKVNFNTSNDSIQKTFFFFFKKKMLDINA